MMTNLKLSYGLVFEDLYNEDKLPDIDGLFVDSLSTADSELKARLDAVRADPDSLDEKAESDLILELAPHLEDFLGTMFGVERELKSINQDIRELDGLYSCKRLFVQRRAAKTYKADEAQGFNGPALEADLKQRFGGNFDQQTFAKHVNEWLEDAEANAESLEIAARYAAWALHTHDGRERHRDDILFRQPEKIDIEAMVPFETFEDHGIEMMRMNAEKCHHYDRDAFSLTDEGADLVGALDEVNYCVICHERGRDFCSRGMRDKQTGKFSSNTMGVDLNGCPLEEKISEMHKAKMEGNSLAALAIIAIDNPTVAATGHRICNDCMKACIYQKQTPVNIPQAETRVLKDVLALPWGFEIYSLLTRWNPLNFRTPWAKAESNRKILIVGAGPAGFSLAHFLMNEGHTAVVIDGLKIEPLDPEISGVDQDGNRHPFHPIHDVKDIWEPLDERVQAGFGGVAEYGITVRWDKNFLKLVRLLIERRKRCAIYGGVRFGSAITEKTAFEMGFDHVALAMGAGKPTFLSVPNGMARGVRQASDLLMALQLTGAAMKDSVANLQIRLPAVIIGGGLTAIDTATEVLAYYVRQVEKFTIRYDLLVAENGAEKVRSVWTEEELIIADEFITHGRAVIAEREQAAIDGRDPHFITMLDSWGGATLAYRRKMTGSPAYRLNHEEIEKAFEQGIRFAELLSPTEIEVDEYNHVKAIRLEHQEIGEDGRPKPTGKTTVLPARSVLIAAGTQPNTVLEREYPGFTGLDGKYFQALDEDGNKVSPEWSTKPDEPRVLTKIFDTGRSMSFFGDLHPSFAGNVVKAISSAKQGYPVINRMLAKTEPTEISPQQLISDLNYGLRAVVKKVSRLTHNVVEVRVRAPLAAKAYKSGQFFRIQNYIANSETVNGTTMAMEGVALTGALVDPEEGEVSVIAMDMGGSTNILHHLREGEHITLMGPTGEPTHTPGGETVLLCGGGLGNAVLLDINKAFHKAGSRVLYFAAYKQMDDRFHIENIKSHSDVVVWCCDNAPGFEPDRPQDKTFVGNIVQAMTAYAKGELGEVEIPLNEVDHIIAIGSHFMMKAVGESRHTVLKDFLKPGHKGIASINSPMQCMMKEICGQCLQVHRNPETGEETVIFSCFSQDQDIDLVDFDALHQRLLQNGVQEKLTRQWIAHCKDGLTKIRPGV